MTTEEKARAYEMALEAARKELGVDRKEWEVVQRVLHNIFPVLCESEDEKIRKAILGLSYLDGIEPILTKCSVTRSDIRSYLEKQKESLHIQETCKENADSFTDEDERIREEIKEFIFKRADRGDLVAKRKKWIAYLEKQKEQKPAEWSKEDERMRNQLIYDVEYHKKEGLISAKQNKATKSLYNGIEKCYDEKIAWLKALRPQIIDSKPLYTIEQVNEKIREAQEWSEEDERKYQCIRNILLTDVDKKVGSWKYSEILEWYEKRGIGRYTNSQPHWKPSEEQMQALHELLGKVPRAPELYELFNDLNKL